MQLLDTIRVPWTPYGLTFSRDGARLAVGGGTFYGNGGIVVRTFVDASEVNLDWRDYLDNDALFPPQKRAVAEAYTNNWTRFDSCGMGLPAVSSLCFSDDGAHLAATMWHGGWRYAPTVVFGTGSERLTVDAVVEGHDEGGTCHTGVLLHRGQVAVRRHALFPHRKSGLAIDSLPLESSGADGRYDHLTHSRIVVRRGVALTAGSAYADSGHPCRLVARAFDEVDVEDIEVGDSRGVSAISACREEDRFVTGGFDGEIDLWQWDSVWRPTRVRPAKNLNGSIRELVTARGGQLVAVTDAGVLLVGSPDGEFVEWGLPVPGRPRSLAAHPHEDVVAIGLKGGGWQNPASEIVFVGIA